MSSVIFYLI